MTVREKRGVPLRDREGKYLIKYLNLPRRERVVSRVILDVLRSSIGEGVHENAFSVGENQIDSVASKSN